MQQETFLLPDPHCSQSMAERQIKKDLHLISVWELQQLYNLIYSPFL